MPHVTTSVEPPIEWMNVTAPTNARAVEWLTYYTRARNEWQVLLEDPRAADGGKRRERPLHEFLERNPSFVPGAAGFRNQTGHARGHHGPVQSLLFTEPRLAGAQAFRPDFMWITKDSAAVRPVLVEIEAPWKTWYLQGKTEVTAELKQAHGQLATWRTWLRGEGHEAVFKSTYNLAHRYEADGRGLRFRYILGYGRSGEFEPHLSVHGDQARFLREMRDELAAPDEELRTLDSFGPESSQLEDVITVKHTARGLEAVAVAPTFHTGHLMAEAAANIKGLKQAVERLAGVDHVTDERISFLKDRIDYLAARWRSDRDPQVVLR